MACEFVLCMLDKCCRELLSTTAESAAPTTVLLCETGVLSAMRAACNLIPYPSVIAAHPSTKLNIFHAKFSLASIPSACEKT